MLCYNDINELALRPLLSMLWKILKFSPVYNCRCHEIEYPSELEYPGDTLFLSPSIPHLVKSQPIDKKLQA